LEATVLKLGPLAELALPQRGEITMQCLLTDTGIDISIKGAGRVDLLNRAQLEKLIAEANALNLARLSFDGDPIVERTKPILRMASKHSRASRPTRCTAPSVWSIFSPASAPLRCASPSTPKSSPPRATPKCSTRSKRLQTGRAAR